MSNPITVPSVVIGYFAVAVIACFFLGKITFRVSRDLVPVWAAATSMRPNSQSTSLNAVVRMSNGEQYGGFLSQTSTDYDVVKQRDKEFSLEHVVHISKDGMVEYLGDGAIVVINTLAVDSVHFLEVPFSMTALGKARLSSSESRPAASTFIRYPISMLVVLVNGCQ